MTDMVERVARAIAQADEQNGGPPYEMVVGNKHSKEHLFDRARAAIEAMREPTEGMLDEGHNRMDFDDSLAPDADQYNRSVAGRVFTAMIDAALSRPRLTNSRPYHHHFPGGLPFARPVAMPAPGEAQPPSPDTVNG